MMGSKRTRRSPQSLVFSESLPSNLSWWIPASRLGVGSDRQPSHNRNGFRARMRKLGIALGILATVFCLPANAQTTSVMVLDQAGAQAVLQAAIVSAQQRNAPSAIAVVDPAGDLLAFRRMDGVRPASA